RGGSAQDILKLAQEFCDETFFLAAPGATNNSWYPYSFMVEESKNEPWLSSAVENVKKLIDDISINIPTEQIYILGFSQGACLALETTARFPAKYGGVIAFTGGLIGETLNESKYKGDFAGTKIFIGTSDQDPHVPLSRAEASRDLLKRLGANVTFKVYPGMGHKINADEINWVKALVN
ncbi:MAG: dienelactone hydrolase family protein, partial [Parachlamydiaceae bacterium]|nr:dienelactone hydrolase family protein [Parachlamydiaceae bacterium]